VLKAPTPTILATFSPSPSPVKPTALTTYATASKKKKGKGSDSVGRGGISLSGPGTALKRAGSSGTAVKAKASSSMKIKGSKSGNVSMLRHFGGSRTPLRALTNRDLDAAAKETASSPPISPPSQKGMAFARTKASPAPDLAVMDPELEFTSSQGSLCSQTSTNGRSSSNGESCGSASSDTSRRAKRVVPGSPREESSSLSKTTRLFSPVVRKKNCSSAAGASFPSSRPPPESKTIGDAHPDDRSTEHGTAGDGGTAAFSALDRTLSLSEDRRQGPSLQLTGSSTLPPFFSSHTLPANLDVAPKTILATAQSQGKSTKLPTGGAGGIPRAAKPIPRRSSRRLSTGLLAPGMTTWEGRAGSLGEATPSFATSIPTTTTAGRSGVSARKEERTAREGPETASGTAPLPMPSSPSSSLPASSSSTSSSTKSALAATPSAPPTFSRTLRSSARRAAKAVAVDRSGRKNYPEDAAGTSNGAGEQTASTVDLGDSSLSLAPKPSLRRNPRRSSGTFSITGAPASGATSGTASSPSIARPFPSSTPKLHRVGTPGRSSRKSGGGREGGQGGNGNGPGANYSTVFAEAETDDLEYLAAEMKKGGEGGETAWRFGFGKGFVLFLPGAWAPLRRARVRYVLLQLGFQGQMHGGRVCYRVSQARAGELKRELWQWRAAREERDGDGDVADEDGQVATFKATEPRDQNATESISRSSTSRSSSGSGTMSLGGAESNRSNRENSVRSRREGASRGRSPTPVPIWSEDALEKAPVDEEEKDLSEPLPPREEGTPYKGRKDGATTRGRRRVDTSGAQEEGGEVGVVIQSLHALALGADSSESAHSCTGRERGDGSSSTRTLGDACDESGRRSKDPFRERDVETHPEISTGLGDSRDGASWNARSSVVHAEPKIPEGIFHVKSASPRRYHNAGLPQGQDDDSQPVGARLETRGTGPWDREGDMAWGTTPAAVAIRVRPTKAEASEGEQDSLISWGGLSLLSDRADDAPGSDGKESSFLLHTRRSMETTASTASYPVMGRNMAQAQPMSPSEVAGSDRVRRSEVSPVSVIPYTSRNLGNGSRKGSVSPLPTALSPMERWEEGGREDGALWLASVRLSSSVPHSSLHPLQYPGDPHSQGHSHGPHTFETPMGGKRRDWGESTRASSASIERLTLRFQSSVAEGGDQGGGEEGCISSLPSHLRYGMHSPPLSQTTPPVPVLEPPEKVRRGSRRLSLARPARPLHREEDASPPLSPRSPGKEGDSGGVEGGGGRRYLGPGEDDLRPRSLQSGGCALEADGIRARGRNQGLDGGNGGTHRGSLTLSPPSWPFEGGACQRQPEDDAGEKEDEARAAAALRKKRASAAKARRVSMGLAARASLIKQHLEAWRQGGLPCLAPFPAVEATGGPTKEREQTEGTKMDVASRRAPHQSRASLCSALGGLSLLGGVASPSEEGGKSGPGEKSLLLSTPAVHRRISEGSREDEEEGEVEETTMQEGGWDEGRDHEHGLREAWARRSLASFATSIPASEPLSGREAHGEDSFMLVDAPPARSLHRTSLVESSDQPPGPLVHGVGLLGKELLATCLEFLSVQELRGRERSLGSVSRTWAVSLLHAEARIYSSFEKKGSRKGGENGEKKQAPRHDVVVGWDHIAEKFPCGKFLSEGTYKTVYEVWATDGERERGRRGGRVEALSVMDVNAITASGNAAILAQELRASILMSWLVRRGICPNHVETYGVLRTQHAPREAWECPPAIFHRYVVRAKANAHKGTVAQGSEAFLRHTGGKGWASLASSTHALPPPPVFPSVPSRSTVAQGDLQLIRMELCRHGDLEKFLRERPLGALPPGLTRLLLFQMCFALYAARETYAMRHYDLKLLNFLLADFLAPASVASSLPASTFPDKDMPLGSSRVLQERQSHSEDPRSIMEDTWPAGCDKSNAHRTSKDSRCPAPNVPQKTPPCPGTVGNPATGAVEVRYGLGLHVYRLRFPPSLPLCVKLADFGTADLAPETFGQPVGLDQFTTLENTPVDFLVLGDGAKQDFAADAFSLGLAVWHLFVGRQPYEELMEEVRCPPPLRRALNKAWRGKGYTVLRKVLEAGEDEEEDEEDWTLHHTFYRYLVLLGLPSEEEQRESTGRARGLNPVWKAVASCIGPHPVGHGKEDQSTAAPIAFTMSTRKRTTRACVAGTPLPPSLAASDVTTKERVTRQYWQDHASFSLRHGSHPSVLRGRERLAALPGAFSLLRALLDYLPQRRPGMYEALTSELFACLREPEEKETGHDARSFLSYYRGESLQGGRRNPRTGMPLRVDV